MTVTTWSNVMSNVELAESVCSFDTIEPLILKKIKYKFSLPKARIIKTFVDKQGIKHGDPRVPSKKSTKSSPTYELINMKQ